MNSARLCSLSGRYDNTIPTQFLAPIDCLKIPAQSAFSDPILKFVYTKNNAATEYI
jgi:hypothetical protein